MIKRIGSIFLLFILTIELISCHSIVEQNPSLNNNEKHQSISNHDVRRTENIADSMKDGTQNPTIIENELYPDRSSSLSYTFTTIPSHSSLTEENDERFECGSPENLSVGHFSGYDYAVVLGMLVISLGIGVFYGFFKKTESSGSSDDFLLGTGMTVLPVTLSLTTSFITAIELLGNPSEMFYQGTQFSLIVLPMILVIPVAIKIFYPLYFKLDLTSCYEYLGIRFGKDIRVLGATLYIIQMCFYTAVAVLAPAIALSKATGLNTRVAVILIYLVCIFYSSQGGMKAVVIADTFQACVLAFSLVLIVLLGYFYSGTPSEVIATASENNRLEFFNFDPNPTTRHTVFSVVIGGFFYWTSLFCTNQASVQKCMSLKSLKLAKLALGFAILGLIVVFLINFYTGLMVFTHYSSCDPLSSGEISASDQLLPFYVMDVYEKLYSVTGIFVAGIFAASLGTVASALNSMAAVTCEDLLANGLNIKIRPEKGAYYAKWMSLGYGILSFILVFIVEKLGGVLQATLTLNGLVGGVTLGLFVLGIAFKKANAKGAFYGGLISLILVIYVGVMAQLSNVELKPLPVSLANCECYVNTTINEVSNNNLTTIMGYTNSRMLTTESNINILNATKTIAEEINGKVEMNSSVSPIYRISYMWYSAIGAILTILLGLLISVITDAISRNRVIKITAKNSETNNIDRVVVVKPQTISKLEETLKSQYNSPERQLNVVGILKSEKSGIDNFALKLDDEK